MSKKISLSEKFVDFGMKKQFFLTFENLFLPKQKRIICCFATVNNVQTVNPKQNWWEVLIFLRNDSAQFEEVV